MNPLFRHNEKLIDINDFLDNLEENQPLTGDMFGEEQPDLFDALGG